MPPHEHTHGSTGWDQADTFATVWEPLTIPYGLDALAALGGRPGDRLLDVGAGTGGVAVAAARLGLTVTAVDFTPAMVAYASNRAAVEGLTNLDVRAMDGQAMTFPDEAFDLALSVFGVFLFPDHARGLAEMRRVLRPGGRAAVVAWAPPERMANMSAWLAAFRAEYPDFPGLDRPAGWRAMDTPDGLAAEMARAGFGEVEVRLLRHEWTVPSAEWLAENGGWKPLFEELFLQLGPDSRDRVRNRLLADLRAQHGDGPLRLTGEAHLGIGTAGTDATGVRS